jgi:hypothetical protein
MSVIFRFDVEWKKYPKFFFTNLPPEESLFPDGLASKQPPLNLLK